MQFSIDWRITSNLNVIFIHERVFIGTKINNSKTNSFAQTLKSKI